MFLILVLTTLILLSACSDKDSNSNGSETSETEVSDNEKNNNKEEDTEVDENKEEESIGEKDEEQETSEGNFSVELEDQLDLTVGDTGVFDTTLGKYEMTLNSAKLLGAEFDGEETLLDELILLDITIKNVSDNEMKIEELMESMGVSSDLDGSNSYDGAEDFDSIDKFAGVLAPGEEKSGQFITDVYTAEEYYFKKDTGNITGGSSNQVIWTIKADEAQ